MSLITLLRLILRNRFLLILSAGLAGSMTFHMTKNLPKEYESNSLLNTGLVSGYNIESSNGGRIDYGYTNNEMENILGIAKSRETFLEIGAHLLAQCLMQKTPSVEFIGETAFNELKKEIPEDIRAQIVDYQFFEATKEKIEDWRDSDKPNVIKTILEGGHSLFGVDHIEKLVIKREGNSDQIKVAYTSTDPSICRNTIEVLVKVFTDKYRMTKENQSGDVLNFFEKTTNESAAALSGKEDNMLSFMVDNKIINYYEQTRFIASKKEELDELYFKEMMHLAAADSARRNLEAQLGNRASLPKINENIARQRLSLSSISSRLANLEIGSLDDSTKQVDVKTVRLLQNQAEKLKADLRRSAESIFGVERTPEGVEVKNILAQWLNQWIEVEQGLARITVFKERNAEFDRIYSKFAPWGSKIKRLEREIEVAEKAYLENLHSTNVVRMHKLNTMMSGKIRIVDPPHYPDKPNPSKRSTLLILSVVVGLVLPLALLIALEMLDATLRTPENAAAITGMQMFTALPKLPKNWAKHPIIRFDMVVARGIEQLLQHLKIDLQLHTRTVLARIAILSTNDGDGKTAVGKQAVAMLRTYGHRVLYIRPDDKPLEDEQSHEDNKFYTVDFSLIDKEDEADLLQGEDIVWHHYNYIITEIPSLIEGNYPARLFSQIDVALLVCRANRSWLPADKRAIETINKFLKRPCRLVLNAVRIDLLEDSIGEIPRQRSPLRRKLKRLMKRNWSGN
jgi:polysaccharide biosynthesis transport protein